MEDVAIDHVENGQGNGGSSCLTAASDEIGNLAPELTSSMHSSRAQENLA